MSHRVAKQITVRGIPEVLYQSIQSEAKLQGTSINRVLLHRLDPVRRKESGGACAGLLNLAGTWDEKRVKDFERSFPGHRRIDSELWS